MKNRETPLPPLEERLLALDVPAAEAAVDSAIDQAQSDAALMPDEHRKVASFLGLAAHGAGLDAVDVRFETLDRPTDAEGTPITALQVVDVIVEIEGDIYDLPIFLDGVHRQRALGRLQSLAFDVDVGGAMRGRVQVRYYRPGPVDTSWISDHLSLAAPGADRAIPVLALASELAAWRSFVASLPTLQERASRARNRAARELPPNLISLRSQGGRFVWDADAGIAIR